VKVLIIDVSKLKTDMEEAFRSIRKINKRHDIETGEEIIVGIWQKRATWFFDKLSVPVLMTMLFLLWTGDKFNWFVKIGDLWREFKK